MVEFFRHHLDFMANVLYCSNLNVSHFTCLISALPERDVNTRLSLSLGIMAVFMTSLLSTIALIKTSPLTLKTRKTVPHGQPKRRPLSSIGKCFSGYASRFTRPASNKADR